MKQLIQLVALLCFLTKGYSQDFRLGKVSVKELEEISHPADTSAVASVLYKKGHTYFELDSNSNFYVVNEVEVRIKIYKKEGFKYADFQKPFYIGGGKKESVVFSDVATYNLVKGKVDKTRIKKEGEFQEKINENWEVKKITLPNIKEGSVIEYKYVHKTPYYSSLTDWYFQTDIPVNKIDYSVVIPEYFVYRASLNSPEIRVNQETGVGSQTISQTQHTSYGTTAGASIGTLSYKETKTYYSGENLPALIDEDYVNNIRNYTASVKRELIRTQFPNGIKDYAITWEDVSKTIYNNKDFGRELNQTSYFEKELRSIIPVEMSQNEKIKTIFEFVQKNITWNEKFGYLCRDGVEKAYKSKSGNVAEVNLMLTSMLSYFGIKAYPVLVSTRSNGIPIFPSRDAFNYVITAVILGNETILLDATNKYTTQNILPVRALNWNGKLIEENGNSSDINLYPNTISRNITFGLLSLNPNGEISGEIRHQFFDYYAYEFRDRYNNISTDSYLENMEKRLSNIEIADDYSLTNPDDLSKPVTEKFSFSSDGFVDVIGNKMYFSPMLFYKILKNPFTKEKRNYPIDFIYPKLNKYTISYILPEGYEIEHLPESLNLGLPDNLGYFKFLIGKSSENQIQLAVDYRINSSLISEVYYEGLKEFFKVMVEKQNEKIILKKI